ncbi:Cyclic peptide export ABC transporter [Sulfidibacter corallicola]|uniref:Cyclic peptide export ABC transporter n=1 Tax=Sulfidibacter corallicola TaxID=2818388 RepID=A0A8A4TJ29_SULCO|nr:cyclic peptide export ABC transporter [Sulfidibacter corallicola]QTD48808.1 cyclic peptide export ABC transporter [Sulfidibacter corallicola]
MSLIRALYQRSKVLMIVALLANVLSATLGVVLIAMINQSVASGDFHFTGGIPLFVALALALFVSGIVSQDLLNRLGAHIVRELRLMMVRRVLATPLARIERMGGHRIYTLLTNDIGNLSWAFGMVPVIAMNAMIVLMGFFYLGYLSPIYLAATVTLIVVGVGGTQLLLRRMRGLFEENRRRFDELYRHFGAVVHGGKELRINALRERHFLDRMLGPTADQLFHTGLRSDLFGIVSNNWNNLMLFGILGTVIFSSQWISGIGLDVLVGYVLTLIYLRGPISSLVGALPAYTRGQVAMKQFEDLDLIRLEDWREGDQAPPQADESSWSTLSLRDVTYRYPGNDDEFAFRLGPLSLDLEPGELVFFIGGNGSGKSTFAKLVTGLYQPTGGEIRLDGNPIVEENRKWYRNHFTAVFSDFYLFSQVLASSGSHGEDDQVVAYLKRLCLDHKVEVQDGALSTTELSTGQRKRLAFLMAYMEDRPIFLFDEWAADQDPIFREIFYTELLPELRRRGKAVLVITHDDRYFHLADRLFKFENGRPTQLAMGDRPETTEMAAG